MKAPRLFSGFGSSDHVDAAAEGKYDTQEPSKATVDLYYEPSVMVMKEGTEMNGKEAGFLGDPNWLSRHRKTTHPVRQLAFQHGPKCLLS